MTFAQRIAGIGTVTATLYAMSTPALAHHVMDGQMPRTLVQGLLSGFGHPIIGIDHLLFIIGVGLLAGVLGRKVMVPLAFILGTLGGAAVHLSGLNIAFAELAILASVALMAVAVFISMRPPVLLTAVLVAAAGIFHGYAYAESIFGAEPTPLYAYLAGFAIIQFTIVVGAATGLELLQRHRRTLAPTSMRVAGGVMAAFVIAAIGQMTFGV
jgi:urease accessory protein